MAKPTPAGGTEVPSSTAAVRCALLPSSADPGSHDVSMRNTSIPGQLCQAGSFLLESAIKSHSNLLVLMNEYQVF